MSAANHLAKQSVYKVLISVNFLVTGAWFVSIRSIVAIFQANCSQEKKWLYKRKNFLEWFHV